MTRTPVALQMYVFVAMGSGLGSVLRYATDALAPVQTTWGLPLATFTVNVIGSAFIGFFATLSGPDGRWLVSPVVRQGVMIGFCGGLTTFSAFSLEGVLLANAHEVLEAFFYVLASLTGWLAAAWMGQAAAFRLIR